EIKGKHHSMFVDSAYRSSSEYRQFWDDLNRGITQQGEFRRFGKGSKEVWIQASYTPIKDMNGKPFRVVKYATDITEQKLQNAYYAGQIQGISESQAVIEFEMDGKIVNANDNFLNTVGYMIDEIKGKHHSMFVDSAYRASPEYRQFWDDLNRGITQQDEFKRFGKGGKEIWIQASYTPIKDMNGTPFRVVKYATDITEQKTQNLKYQKETARLAQSARDGALNERGDENAFSGEYKPLIAGLNNMLDAIVEPIQGAIVTLEQLAAFDLRSRMQGDYKGDFAKMKDSINSSGTALHDAMAQVADSVEQVSSASGQIASSSQQVAEGTSEQASSLEETSSSLEEMSGMTKQNADNTQQAKGLAENTRDAAGKGAEAMSKMMDSMGKIKSAAEGTAEIIKDINEIAFQTNLLALNAAVEAARAGDAGRGFAVVAEEVRNLAGRAKDAAKNTEELIKQSVSLADDGERISTDVNGNLNEIVDSVGKVTDLVGEITVASQEQARGIDQVNNAMAQMDKVVQQAAANSEESSSAAEELSGQAQELAAMVGKFQLNRKKVSAAQRNRAHEARMQVAAAPNKSGGGNGKSGFNMNPEELIPMDDDPDFAEF
ncbi:MAG: PAS domain S-box protein, partial [Proteobacteria bacterium]|nr:PAS domain S-box protein [Pseudomonadota bacterium]